MGEWGLIFVAWLTLFGVGFVTADTDTENQTNCPIEEYAQVKED